MNTSWSLGHESRLSTLSREGVGRGKKRVYDVMSMIIRLGR